jgi:hypothetical protein
MSDRLTPEEAAQLELQERQIRTLSGELDEPDLDDDDLAELA